MPSNEDLFRGMPPEVAARIEQESIDRERMRESAEAEYADMRGPISPGMKDAVDPTWIAAAPMVRVLMEMPEEDALTLRRLLAEARNDNDMHRPIIRVEAKRETPDVRELEIHVKEILLYG